MTLGDLFKWCDTIVPEVTEDVIPSISSTKLDKRAILNAGAAEFVLIANCFPKEKKISCIANNPTYSLSSNISDFMSMREEGVWHLRSDASVNTWERLKPKTIRDLDQEFTNWRDQDPSDLSLCYYQDGDTLGIFYTPSTAVTNGFNDAPEALPDIDVLIKTFPP